MAASSEAKPGVSTTSGAHLSSLHVSGTPVIFANIWDIPSLNAVLSLNKPGSQPVKALATASYAVAESLGIRDEELSLAQNLTRIKELAPRAAAAGLPLSVDLQDGYGDRLDEAVRGAVQAGAAGANVEDSIPAAGFGKGIEGSLYALDEQVARLKRVLQVAAEAGEPGFTLNARCDVFRLTPYAGDNDAAVVAEAVRRGKAYLEAGATTVFYWAGGGRGLRDEEVRTLVKELGGRVAVKLAEGEGALTTKELGQLGVARISVGPSLYLAAHKAIKEAAARILTGGGL